MRTRANSTALPCAIARVLSLAARRHPIPASRQLPDVARWPERPPVRRLIGAVASTPLAFLLVCFALAVGPLETPRWISGVLAAVGVLASYLLAIVVTAQVNNRLSQIERQRDAFYQELGRLSRAAALGDISLSIAHDLNNPLAIANEEAGWLLDLLSPNEPLSPAARAEAESSVRQIQLQVARASDFSRRVLNWAREADELGKGVDLAVLLNKSLYLLESDLAEKDVRVVRQFEAGAPPAAGSTAELRQVFLHLMKNAIDAMNRAGTLTLSIAANGDTVIASVADTGTGIAPERLPFVFEPFYTTKPEGRGSGLGLPIANWIVQRAGGRIAVESVVAQGTMFRVTLPALRAVPVPSPTAARPEDTHEHHSTAAR
jgi:signal transduction histidine kinase